MELHDVRTDEQADAWAHAFIQSVITACPRRQPTSRDERQAQGMVAEAFGALGLKVEEVPFTFNDNLYANLVLHFGLGPLGSLAALGSPALALALHALAAASYTLDSTRKAFVLRRLLGFKPSVNVLATLPARGERRLRVVFVSHIDAAFTGTLFEPWFVGRFGAKPGPLYKSLRVATASLAALALLDAYELAAGPSTATRALRVALTIPSLLATALNIDIVARNHIVPGANDNLSGTAGGLLLAHRLRESAPEGVEFVFVSAGCEEASLGGSDAVARWAKGRWATDDTVILGIDGFSNGTLHWFHEGEVLPVEPTRWLDRILRDMAGDPRWSELRNLDIPVGGTDAVPFRVRGFDGVTVGCVDAELKAPRHYHLPSDTVENLDAGKIAWCVRFCEDLVDRIAKQHPTRGSAR